MSFFVGPSVIFISEMNQATEDDDFLPDPHFVIPAVTVAPTTKRKRPAKTPKTPKETPGLPYPLMEDGGFKDVPLVRRYY